MSLILVLFIDPKTSKCIHTLHMYMYQYALLVHCCSGTNRYTYVRYMCVYLNSRSCLHFRLHCRFTCSVCRLRWDHTNCTSSTVIRFLQIKQSYTCTMCTYISCTQHSALENPSAVCNHLTTRILTHTPSANALHRNPPTLAAVVISSLQLHNHHRHPRFNWWHHRHQGDRHSPSNLHVPCPGVQMLPAVSSLLLSARVRVCVCGLGSVHSV